MPEEDWAAVGVAIRRRVRELGWRQHQLAQRSHVSQAVVRELQHHTMERRRSPRTLAALSTALGWHPDHLAAVLHGRPAPAVPAVIEDHAWVQTVDERLHEIIRRLDVLQADIAAIAGHLDACREARAAGVVSGAFHELVGSHRNSSTGSTTKAEATTRARSTWSARTPAP